MNFLQSLLGGQHSADLLIAQAHISTRVNSLTAGFNAEMALLKEEVRALREQVARSQALAAEAEAVIQNLKGEISALQAPMPQLLNAAATVPALAEQLLRLDGGSVVKSTKPAAIVETVSEHLRSAQPSNER